MIPQKIIDFIKQRLATGKIVALTGAGISQESGVPTFRGEGGLWEKYEPETFANPAGLVSTFYSSPQMVVDFVTDFYQTILSAKPNAAHRGLSLMQEKGILSGIITQNVDNLHQQAGSKNVIELHGNVTRRRCIHCKQTYLFSKEEIISLLDELNKYKFSRPRLLRVLSRYFPRCFCRGRMRIDIVLFGEELPEQALKRSEIEIDKASILLLVGTSGLVYPAAGLPSIAKSYGRGLIEINTEPSNLSPICDYIITESAAKAVLEILERLS